MGEITPKTKDFGVPMALVESMDCRFETFFGFRGNDFFNVKHMAL